MSIYFFTRLSISTNRKGKTHDSILVVVNWLTKIVYYELDKITIDTLTFAKIIIKAIV